MKAFQLKIVIKNSKPPIWRRVIVPAGITFSQLSMILNKVMGWSGYHLFEFRFYHLEVCILEDIEEYDYGPNDYIKASKTYIREYLEENDWFTYIYDFGDDWQHRVTIEKIIEDYEYNYPMVLKYKGDCPIEDCGGIWGYYDCLEIINNKTHPEYEERLEWMESQGYPDTYDIDAVNEELKTEYFYNWGKGENRSQRMIYGEIFSGKYGLKATKKDKNKNTPVTVSERHQLKEVMKQFKEVVRYKMEWEQKLAETSLKDIFEDYEKEDILEIAKEKGVKGISKCNKNTLIKYLVEHMLQLDVIKQYFLCLQDDEIEEFEKASNVHGLYTPEDAGIFTTLYEASYVGSLMDGRIIVPRDVAAVYDSFKGKEFEEERKKISYFLCCLDTAVILYGIAPISILVKLVEQNPEVQMTEDEIRTTIIKIPPEIKKYIVIEDTIYRKDLYPDDKGLLMVQGDKEFYIPTLNEIMEFGTKGYISDSREVWRLKQFLIRKMNATAEEADVVCGIIQMQITGDGEIEDIFNVFEEAEFALQKKSQVNELVRCIQDLWNETRMLINRGFTPNEIFMEDKPVQMLPEKSNIIDFAEARKNKIYPNEPCPCGSGKKFKNCCKNK